MAANLDDIVFENRNKDYGAYRLRKSYHRLVNNIFFFCSLGFVVVWIGLLIWSQYEPRRFNDRYLTVNFDDIFYDTLGLSDLPPPPREENKAAEAPVPMIPKKISELTPQVVTRKNLPDLVINKRNETPTDTASKFDRYAQYGEGYDSAGAYLAIHVERLPQFPGGNNAMVKFLRDNINYRIISLAKKGGTVHVSFRITARGEVDWVKVVRSADAILDQEAVRVVKMMPRWIPGLRHGQPVNVLITLPVRFAAS